MFEQIYVSDSETGNQVIISNSVRVLVFFFILYKLFTVLKEIFYYT
jgi:hypothetical protein